MHELGRYLQRELDRRGWTIAELARRATVSRQTVYSLVNDTRDYMDQTPQRKTVNALAEALGVDPLEILTASAQALGVPVEMRPTSDNLEHLSDQQILMELASRLSRSKGQDDNASAAGPPQRPVHSRPQNPYRRPEFPDFLRAVAPEGDTRPGQKTDSPSAYEAEDALDQHGVTQISGAEAESIPVPPLEQLAAHHNFKSEREKWEEAHGERGEENQDSEDNHG